MYKTILLFTILCVNVVIANDLKENYKICASCHGNKGEIKALGKSVKISSLNEKEIKDLTILYRDTNYNKYGMGMIMKSQVIELNDDEIEELAHYISLLKYKK